jgi:signal peptidase II
MQAARGTSIGQSTGPGDDSVGPTPLAASRRRVRTVFALVAVSCYLLDLGTKVLAVSRLSGHPDVHVVGNLLVLHLTRNAGAAFSTGTEYTVLLSCVAALAVLAVLWVSRRAGSLLWAVAFGLLIAGVSGNLTDRLFRSPGPLRGHVIDFLMLPNWPVFNIADMCINVAAGLILLQAFRGVRLDGTRGARPAPAAPGDPEEPA